MKLNKTLIIFLIGFIVSTTSFSQNYTEKDTLTVDDFHFTVERTFVNKSMWSIPYRYQEEGLECLTVKLTIETLNPKVKSIDPNVICLVDDNNKLRIRPSGIFYFKKDKRVYLKSKPVNTNYDSYKEFSLKDYTDFEAEIYKTNMLGLRKKKIKESVQQLKEIPFKIKKITYYLDFPVKEGYTNGKLFFKDKEIIAH